MEKLIQTLPEVAAKIAEPLAKTEKLVFIGGRDDESEKKPEVSEASEGEREPAPALPPMDFDAVVRHMMTRGDGGHLAALMKDHMSGTNSADKATNTSTSEPK